MTYLIDVGTPATATTIAEHLRARAQQLRVAAERFSAEAIAADLDAAGQRAPALKVMRLLGQAGQLEQAAESCMNPVRPEAPAAAVQDAAVPTAAAGTNQPAPLCGHVATRGVHKGSPCIMAPHYDTVRHVYATITPTAALVGTETQEAPVPRPIPPSEQVTENPDALAAQAEAARATPPDERAAASLAALQAAGVHPGTYTDDDAADDADVATVNL